MYVRTITILRVIKILVWRVVNCRDLDEELHQLRATVGERPGDKSDGLVVQFDNQRTYVRTCVRTYVQYCTDVIHYGDMIIRNQSSGKTHPLVERQTATYVCMSSDAWAERVTCVTNKFYASHRNPKSPPL